MVLSKIINVRRELTGCDARNDGFNFKGTDLNCCGTSRWGCLVWNLRILHSRVRVTQKI